MVLQDHHWGIYKYASFGCEINKVYISWLLASVVQWTLFFRHLTLEDEATTQSQNVGQQTLGDRLQYPGRSKILTADTTIPITVKISEPFILATGIPV